ncbi:hypothetical protein [Streptomyces sp. KMM 9044]|uniref:hypothetical protein n=1 Tax=Streptomyces sp. KMM 9044 TaxID=2744474 RepID=UPI002F416A00
MSENHGSSAAEPTERVAAGTTVVAPRGVIDLLTLTAPVLARRLDVLATGTFPTWCSICATCRSSAARACACCAVRAGWPCPVGGWLRLITRSPGLLRLLRHARLAGAFELLPRLPAELDAAAVRPGVRNGACSPNSAP